MTSRLTFATQAGLRIVMLAVTLMALPSSMAAQKSAPGPPSITFSALHTRPSSQTTARVLVLPRGRLSITGITVADLIRRAYGGEFFSTAQVEGPDWLRTDRFDIEARSDAVIRNVGGVLDKTDVAAVLLGVLTTHYRLSGDIQNREVTGYTLRRAGGGPIGSGLRLSQGGCTGPLEYISTEAPSAAVPCQFLATPGRLVASGLSMPQFASLLAEFPAVRQVVRDETGLTGRYDVALTFDPKFLAGSNGALLPNADAGVGVDLRGALEQQLGLALKPGRVRANVIVVKSIVRQA